MFSLGEILVKVAINQGINKLIDIAKESKEQKLSDYFDDIGDIVIEPSSEDSID